MPRVLRRHRLALAVGVAGLAPVDFRKVELVDLEGCTDPTAANDKS